MPQPPAGLPKTCPGLESCRRGMRTSRLNHAGAAPRTFARRVPHNAAKTSDRGLRSVGPRYPLPRRRRETSSMLADPRLGLLRAKGFFRTAGGEFVTLHVIGRRSIVEVAPLWIDALDNLCVLAWPPRWTVRRPGGRWAAISVRLPPRREPDELFLPSY